MVKYTCFIKDNDKLSARFAQAEMGCDWSANLFSLFGEYLRYADTADALNTLSLDVEDACQPPISQPTQPKPCMIYRYVRSLTGIVGEEYGPLDPNIRDSKDYPPRGLLGPAAEKYLDAHGYKGSAVFHILLGFKEAYSPLDFVNYICPRGIPQAEVVYIYELISGSNIGCDDYKAVY